MAKTNVKVQRETFEKNDRTFFTYFVSGVVRGKQVRIGIVPPDKGGYTVLDIVFGDKDEADLCVNPFEIKDETTGKVVRGNTYSVQSCDEFGEIYECPIKPSRPSDKTLLNMLIK